MATAKYDGMVFEMEHNPWDIRALRDSLQYLLNRGQIARAGSVAPGVTPMVRIPPNGGEKTQFHAKQALDLGVYGIVWPHISTVEEAYNAVAACRYPASEDRAALRAGRMRGDGPTQAVRYWGLSQQEYYERADVWPLNPKGEIFVILMMEDTVGIQNLPDILEKVPGIGAILIGEGDLSQELGYPRQYEHPEVLKWMERVVDTCKAHNVVVGSSARRRQQCRAHPWRGLSLPDGGAGTQLCRTGQGAQARRARLIGVVSSQVGPGCHPCSRSGLLRADSPWG